MKSNQLRLIYVIIGMFLYSCNMPWLGKEYELGEAQDSFMEVVIGTYIWSELEEMSDPTRLNCQKTDAIRPSNATECISNKVLEGLIYNQNTNERIIATSISGNIPLECRTFNCPDSASCINTTYGKPWYVTNTSAPAPGSTVQFVYRHDYSYDGAGNVNGIIPFTNYISGDTIICISDMNGYIAYQMLTIN